MENRTAIPDALHRWPGHTGNWNRWPNDRGALNLLTRDVALRGLRAARTGEAIPCARPLQTQYPLGESPQATMSPRAEAPPATHEMTFVGDYGDVKKELGKRPQVSFDRLSFNVHGLLNTHIDAFAHVGFEGYGFNGHPFKSMVTMDGGAMKCDVLDSLAIVTRGVFIDVARKRQVKRLEPGDYVTPKDIAEAAEQIQPGDAFIIRVGGTSNYIQSLNADKPMSGTRRVLAGLHTDSIELLAGKDIAVLGSDSANDTYPNPSPEFCQTPVHVLCLAFYGIPLVHNMDLEPLGEACAAQGRDTFLFVINALNIPRGTGSLCTPVAVL